MSSNPGTVNYLDGYFSHSLGVKLLLLGKTENEQKRGREMPFLKIVPQFLISILSQLDRIERTKNKKARNAHLKRWKWKVLCSKGKR